MTDLKLGYFKVTYLNEFKYKVHILVEGYNVYSDAKNYYINEYLPSENGVDFYINRKDCICIGEKQFFPQREGTLCNT